MTASGGARTIAKFPFLTRGKSHAALPGDEEEIAPLEEFECDVGERLRPLGADGAASIIDEHEVAIASCVR